MLTTSVAVNILGDSIPDSKKSLSPVRNTSTFAAIAARSIGRSFTSRRLFQPLYFLRAVA